MYSAFFGKPKPKEEPAPVPPVASPAVVVPPEAKQAVVDAAPAVVEKEEVERRK